MAPVETLDLTRFTIELDRERGFISEKHLTPDWQSPSICACCAAPAESTWQEQIAFNRGDKKFWLNVEAPYCSACIEHIRVTQRIVGSARNRAMGLAVLLGILILGTLIAVSADAFGDKDLEGTMIGILLLSMCSHWFVFHPWMKRRMRRMAGLKVAHSPDCSVKLDFELASKGLGLLKSAPLQFHVTCGSEPFCDQFRELNQDLIASENIVRGEVQRTAGGGLIVENIKAVKD